MANEISWDIISGITLDAYRFQPNGNVFVTNGSSDEVWATADDYDVTMTEDGVGGHYVGDFDTSAIITAGVYPVVIKIRDGVNPANSDRAVGRGVMYWDGTDELNIFTLDTTINDDVIGADGDTLESLSDQMDLLSSEDSKVLNGYKDGE